MLQRKRFNLDVDGVLADFAQAALDHVFALSGQRRDPSIVRTWEVFDSLPDLLHLRKETYRRMKAAGGCYAIPVYDGAKEAVAELKELVDITIVTSPFKNAPTWMHEREQWLADHFGIDRDRVIHAGNKEAIHADFFPDDKESHIIGWQRYWRARGVPVHGYLWHTGRNTNPAPHLEVVRDWPTLIKLVKQHIEAVE